MATGSPSEGVNACTPPLGSPTFGHSPSFSQITVCSSNDSPEEDEVLWTGNELDSDDDFVLVPHSYPARSVIESEVPVAALAKLSLVDRTTLTTPPCIPQHVPTSSKSKRAAKGRKPAAPTPRTPGNRRRRGPRGKQDAAASYPSPSPSPDRERAPSTIFDEPAIGFGKRLIVEESDGDEPAIRRYEDAVQCITSFLASPTTTTCTRLTFLQSLIIELGLIAPTSALPSSLSAARRFLRARAFVNISAYLSTRGHGLEQLRTAMFSSRRELARDLRRRRGVQKADKGWVKQHGLNVLLVSVF